MDAGRLRLHDPDRLHGVVSGLLQGAFSWGFILAALAFHYVYPLVGSASLGWRAMLWSGVGPALLVLWIRRGVQESPVWRADRGRHRHDLAAALRENLRSEVLRAILVAGALMFAYQSMSFWYATLLRQDGRPPLPFLLALNVGGLIGAALWGSLADTRLGPRGSIVLASTLSVALLPLFLSAHGLTGLWLGALLMGLTGAGVIGVLPMYVATRFSTAFRATGWGMVYHAGAAIGAVAPLFLGSLQDAQWPLRAAMAVAIAAASALAAASVLTEART